MVKGYVGSKIIFVGFQIPGAATFPAKKSVANTV